MQGQTIVWGNGTSIQTATVSMSGQNVNLVLGPAMTVTHTSFSYHGSYLVIACSTCSNGFIQMRTQSGASILPTDY